MLQIPELLLKGYEWKQAASELGIALSAFGYIVQGKTYGHLQMQLQARLRDMRAALKDAPKTCSRCHAVLPRTVQFFELRPRRTDIFYSECRECRRKISCARRLQFKIAVMTHYSGGSPPHCACCRESAIEFLTIDHVNGGGNAHRREAKLNGGYATHLWLKKNGYPAGFRVLCMNCNMSFGQHGYCPHQHDEAP